MSSTSNIISEEQYYLSDHIMENRIFNASLINQQ